MSTETLNTVKKIIQETFENDKLNITRQTTAEDVDEWDSLTHIQLVAALEKHFKVRFALGELQALKNVGDMVDLIDKKTAKK